MSRRLVVVAQPGCKRLQGLVAALAKANQPLPQIVSWSAAIADPRILRTGSQAGDVLRIESPGADSEVWHLLAQRGGFSGHIPDGMWRPGYTWFAGLRDVLLSWQEETQDLVWTHPATHILTMTDKLRCAEVLAESAVPTPWTIAAPATAQDLRSLLRVSGRHAVFVKPRWGSSGAGVLALRYSANREQIFTTAKLVDGVMWNEKRILTYTERAQIDTLLNTILSDGAVVQRWIPKATTESGPFDFRVLVVQQQIAQQTARLGTGPITNLHIDAQRRPVNEVLAKYDRSVQRDLHQVCVRAAACFPGHHAVGIDAMIDGNGRPFVIECNAWGDYLPKLLHNGKDSYETQVSALLARAA